MTPQPDSHQKTSVASQYARVFHVHRSALIDLLPHIPAEHAGYRTWAGALSLVELLDHLAESSLRITALIQERTPAPAPEASASIAQAHSRLITSHQSVMSSLPHIPNAHLARVVNGVKGMRMPIHDLLGLLITHEAHHKGQIWLMVRMLGLQPGLYVQLTGQP